MSINQIRSTRNADIAASKLLLQRYDDIAQGGSSGGKIGDQDIQQLIDDVESSDSITVEGFPVNGHLVKIDTEEERQALIASLTRVKDNRSHLADLDASGENDDNLDRDDLELLDENLQETNLSVSELGDAAQGLSDLGRNVESRFILRRFRPPGATAAAVGLVGGVVASSRTGVGTGDSIDITDSDGNPVRINYHTSLFGLSDSSEGEVV